MSKRNKQQVMPPPPLPPEMTYLKLHVKVFCEFIKDRKTLKVSKVYTICAFKAVLYNTERLTTKSILLKHGA